MKNLILVFALLFPTLAFAQTSRNPCYTTQGQTGTMPNCVGVGTATPLPVTAMGSGGASPANSQAVIQSSQYPVNAVTTTPTAIANPANGTTGAVVSTLPAVASTTTFICGFNVSAVGGTATIGPVQLAGVIGGNQSYEMNSAATPVMLSQSFSPCLPASAANTAITITTVANGTATAVHVNSWGYRL